MMGSQINLPQNKLAMAKCNISLTC